MSDLEPPYVKPDETFFGDVEHRPEDDRVILTFPSWKHALDQCRWRNSSEYRARSAGKAGSGRNRWEKYRDLATQGWPEGRGHLKDFFQDLQLHSSGSESYRETPRLARVGSSVDVPAHIQGVPTDMIRWEKQIRAGRGKIVSFSLNCSRSKGVPDAVARNLGSAIVHLIHQLETRGFRTRVTLVNCVTYKSHMDNKLDICVRLKNPDQQYDPDIIAFAMGHEANLYSIAWPIKESLPKKIGEWWGSTRGSKGGPTDSHLREESDVHIIGAKITDGDWSDPEWVHDWTIKQLESCGVQIDEGR